MNLSGLPIIALLAAGLLIVPVISAEEPNGGYFLISSIPSGADCYFDGEFKGTTPVTFYCLWEPYERTHTYSIRAPWYKEYTGTYTGDPNIGQTITLPTVTLTPGAPPGSISITSDPPGAKAWIENGQSGITPCTLNNVTLGTHTVYAYLVPYQEWLTTVKVSSDQTTYVDAVLELWPSTVPFHVSSTPSGASLYINTVYSGVTPTVVQVGEGMNWITVTKEGYYDAEYYLDFDPGLGDKYLYVELHPIPPATVRINSSPGGAMVYLDGVSVGRTLVGSPLVLTEVKTGTHALLLNKPGYQTSRTNFTVEPRDDLSISIILNPSFPSTTGGVTRVPGSGVNSPPDTGSLYVASYPSNAGILINGNDRGNTDQIVKNVPAGTLNLTLIKSGYLQYTAEISVPGGTLTVLPPVTLVRAGGTVPANERGTLYVASHSLNITERMNGRIRSEK